ncbi:hypothetical protein QE152_g4997 [Popillia japonica]|uniref:RNase H type-1 domain-containing protein n=1 Tax=Popillia japonica TaxID=7064 RepID=A0AAW1MYD2_POPJA
MVNMIILNESQAAIKEVIKKGYSADAHLLELEIRNLILEHNRAGRIVVVWVPRYRGIFGNEAADKLAADRVRGEVRRRKIYPLHLKSIRRQEVKQG